MPGTTPPAQQASSGNTGITYRTPSCIELKLAIPTKNRTGRANTLAWQQISFRGVATKLAVILGVCLFSLAACYRFQGLFVRWDTLPLQSVDMRTLRELAGFLGGVPVPVPLDFVLGLDAQRAIMEGPHPTFLDGKWSLTGFPSYFFWALAYKLPIGVLVLSGLGSLIQGGGLLRKRFAMTGALVLPVLFLVGIASFSSMQLGVRYVMPVLPLLACCAGGVVPGIASWNRQLRSFVLVVATVGLLSVWRFHPHHLSYFNELAGGPSGGRRHLVDSNIDWGQDLLRARDTYSAHRSEAPRFAYFGTVDPRRVGMPCVPPPSRVPEPGWYLVSVNFVMGRPGTTREADGRIRSVDVNEFSYFQKLQPIEHIGYSIDLYHITAEDCERWKARSLQEQR